MGSNPSKSQQLSERFPEYKILPELSLHPSNSYELIYVVKLATNQIFTIKETTRENAPTKDVAECQNILRCLESRKIDNMYYSIYQWIPTTLDRFISSHPSVFNSSFFIYVIQTLIRTYALLWKSTNGVGLDIDSDNIRAVRDPFGNLHIKVFPPSITYCSFPQRTKVYRNEIKNLGEVLRKLCVNREKQIGQQIFNFIAYRMTQNLPNSYESWDALERDSKRLAEPLKTPRKQPYEFSSSTVVNNMEQLKPRSVPPHLHEKNLPPVRSPSPHNFSQTVQNADHSPQISRVIIRQKTPIVFSNVPVSDINPPRYRIISTTPLKDQRKPILQNFNSVRPEGNQVRPVSPINIHQKPQLFTLHQNLPQNYSTSPCRIKIDYKDSSERSLMDRQNLVTPSPMRYYHQNRTQSSKPSNKSNENYHQTYQSKELTKQRSFNLLQKKSDEESKYKTLNEKRLEASQNKTEAKILEKSQVEQKGCIESPRIKKINKTVKIPLFEPLARDFLEINPKLGVPSNKYIPKTREDSYNVEENVQQSFKSSLNLQTSGENFIQKHLMGRDAGQLLGSSIPMISADKQSSFGLSVSEDSYDENNLEGIYDGVYEGAFHPKFKNVRHGAGRLVFPSGGSYQGGFAWNKMDGWGKLFYPSGRLAYEGYWKNSKFEGYGKLFNENPLHIATFDCTNFNLIQQNSEQGYWKFYEGNMSNDMKQGHGVWVLQNGEKYDGEFHEDRVEGYGTFYGKKECIEGNWQNNILINIIKRV